MKTHCQQIKDCRDSLRLWQAFTKTLNPDQLKSATNFFVGSVCALMPPDQMADHLALVEKIIGEERDGHGN